MADGARLLPVLGAVLFLIPLLWRAGPDTAAALPSDGQRTAWVMTYLFLTWLGLAVVAGLLSRFLPNRDAAAEDDGER